MLALFSVSHRSRFSVPTVFFVGPLKEPPGLWYTVKESNFAVLVYQTSVHDQ